MALAVAAALGLALLAAPGSPTAPSAEELASRVVRRHQAITALEARFVQVYRSGALGREIVEKGRLSLRRPGRMRWEYVDPEKKLFVCNGQTIFFYVPAERQVVVQPQGGQQGLAFRLLAGEIDILKEFEVRVAPGTTAPTPLRLDLKSRAASSDIDEIHLEADDSYRIQSIEIIDGQLNHSRFRFEQVRENRPLPDALFEFKIPAGVEVVQG
jgi:outer membrane lipoprotein carrier protein